MKKKGLLIGISAAFAVSAISAVVIGNNSAFSVNADHVHEGYHYDEVAATSTSYGHKEHWTCCTCHQSFTSNPGGDFTDKGTSEAYSGGFNSKVKYQYLSLDKQDGTGGTDSVNKVVINEDLPSIEVPSKQGYYFLGYYSDVNGGGTQYYDSYGDGVNQFTTSVINTILYANYEARQYQINVISNDTNKGTVSGGGTFDYNSSVTISATPKDGYAFNGWYSDINRKILVSFDSSYTFNVPYGGKTYYAKFVTTTEQETWDKNHGVTPVIDSVNQTLTYGLFPQLIVSNPSDELKNAGSSKSEEEYFYYDGDFYVRDTARPFNSAYSFSDGTTIISGETYYFKCQPITWNICATSSNEYTLDSSKILYTGIFDKSVAEYSTSDLRTYLTTNFGGKAFSIKGIDSYLLETSVSGGTGIFVKDKVWTGSRYQYNGEWSRYSTPGSRVKAPTDFALCNYSFMFIASETYYTGCSSYWTRSIYDAPYEEFPAAVGVDGNITYYYEFENLKQMGIVPAVRILVS